MGDRYAHSSVYGYLTPLTTETNMQCEICKGDGWVCENHPNQPQCHSDDCGGAGEPCICNPNYENKFTEVFVTTEM